MSQPRRGLFSLIMIALKMSGRFVVRWSDISKAISLARVLKLCFRYPGSASPHLRG